MIKQKKGEIFQIFIFLIIILVCAIVGLLCLTMTTKINRYWIDSGTLNSTQIGISAIEKIQDTAPKTTDYAILFLFIGMNIGLLIGAVRTNFSPLTIILFIFLVFIAIFVAAGMVNMYQGLAQAQGVESGDLHFTNFLFSKYLPLIVCVLSALIMIIMYSKQGGEIIQ
jgi:hypothetical protein